MQQSLCWWHWWDRRFRLSSVNWQALSRSLVTLVVCLALSGCGGRKRVRLPTAARLGSMETGVASWYGYPYHGRRAANGEIYDMEKMTAAHRTLPFGTWVRVKNIDNNQTVDVRITDRGPFVKGRFLDLSRAAAASIAMIGPGTAKVKITVIAAPALVEIATPTPTPPALVAAGQFAVQVGAFSDKNNAERIRSSMERLYGNARIVMRDGKPALWRVLVGSEATPEDAEALAVRIRARGAVRADSAFVVRVDTEPGGNTL
jgi:rare lipoprotein A